MSDRRTLDHGREEAIAQYLDANLYPEIATEHHRVEDKATQTDGVDVAATIPGTGTDLAIDEKAQLDYLNDPVPSFVLEVDFIDRRDTLHPGWFFDPEKATEYYLFAWGPEAYLYGIKETQWGAKIIYDFPYDEAEIDAVKSMDWEATHRSYNDEETWWEFDYDAAGIEAFEDAVRPLPAVVRDQDLEPGGWIVDDRSVFTAVLVDRHRLQSHLDSQGLDEERVHEDAKAIRDQGIIDDHQPGAAYDFKYHLSDHKAERPLNIVMQYSRLHDLAEETYEITADGIETGRYLFDT